MTGLTDLDSRIAAAMAEVAALRHESQDLDARLLEKPTAVDVENLLYPGTQCTSQLPCSSMSSTPKVCAGESVDIKVASLPSEARRISSPCEEPFAEPAVTASSPALERDHSPQVLTETVPQAPLVPKAVARPPRRPKPQQQPREFPSEEQMAGMSRKERIALLEREEKGDVALAPAPAPPPRQQQEFPSDEQMASMSRKERIALLEREEQGGTASAPAPTRAPPQQHSQDFPSDEQMGSMSRKERIALLEREGDAHSNVSRGNSGDSLCDITRDALDQSPKQQRPDMLRRREERQPRAEAPWGAQSSTPDESVDHGKQTVSSPGPSHQRRSPLSTPPSTEHQAPSAATSRRQREEHRPQPVQPFPSDEDFSKMTRKERIALMEREAGGGQDNAGDSSCQDWSRGRAARSQPPRGRADSEIEDSAGTAGCSARGAGEDSASPVSGFASRRRARGSANSDPDRYDGPETSRAARRPLAQPPRPEKDFLSDEAFSSLSRKERIALLEREAGPAEPGEKRTASPSCKLPPIEQSSPRSNPHARERPRIPSVGSRGGYQVDENSERQPGADEEAAFEQRRQDRRKRLQQRQRPDATMKAPHLDDPVDDLKQALRDKNQTHGGELRGIRETQLQRTDRRQAGTSSSAQPPTGSVAEIKDGVLQGRQLLEEMEEMATGSGSSSQWPALCRDLAATAHRLQPADVLRAIQCLSACADGLDDDAAAAMRDSAESLLACVSPQLGSIDSSLIADFLHVMAVANVGEQTYLDMMLAQLLVVLRKNDAAVTPRVLSVLAGSIATLHSKGLSAKKAGSGASSSANKRCVDTLNQRLADALVDFGEDDFARLGGVYLVTFFEDNQRRSYLARAAKLEVGLRPASSNCLVAMKAVEVAVRQHSFAFIATLPDGSKDYLAKLKMTAA